MAEVTQEPWWIAVVVVPLAGFSAWLVKWIIDRQDERDKLILQREQNREKREDERHVAFQQQVGVLASIARELQLLNNHHQQIDSDRQDAVQEILARIDGLPERIVKKCNGGA